MQGLTLELLPHAEDYTVTFPSNCKKRNPNSFTFINSAIPHKEFTELEF